MIASAGTDLEEVEVDAEKVELLVKELLVKEEDATECK